MTDQTVEGRINAHLEEENRRLEAEVERLRWQVDERTREAARQQAGLSEIVKYLPQLAHLSTNTSMVASAVQAVDQHIREEGNKTRNTLGQGLDELTQATIRNAQANEQVADRLHRIVEALEEVSEAWLRKDLRET